MKKNPCGVGMVEGPLNLEAEERVIFAGNCTSWEGNLAGEKVNGSPCRESGQSGPNFRGGQLRVGYFLVGPAGVELVVGGLWT
jgi:hypothetical protein